MNKTITSAANPTVKHLKSLSQKKYRDEHKCFLVEGARHAAEAVAAGWIPSLTVTADGAAATAESAAIENACRAGGGECLRMPEELLQRITGRDNTQHMIAVLPQRTRDIASITPAPGALWLGLEGLRDPGNLGTILRTADAAGVSGVLLIGQTCDPWSPEAVRASMGSFARMPLVRATQAEFLHWRQSWPAAVVGTHLAGAEDYRRIPYALPLLLLMGSEQAGLSAETTASCTHLARIPMAGGTESLNLGVATGIMLYEIQRGRL